MRGTRPPIIDLGNLFIHKTVRSSLSGDGFRQAGSNTFTQEALGGGCRTVMIATISPAQSALDETVPTLQYAEQATLHFK